MTDQSTEGLLDELERLKNLLKEEKDRDDHLHEHIPVLTDIAEHPASEEENRQTVAVLSVQGDYQNAPPILKPASPAINEEIRHQLRSQARLLIREIIDEELVRVEAQLSRELNNYLEHLLSQMPTPPEKQ